jgi:hypothetical protein
MCGNTLRVSHHEPAAAGYLLMQRDDTTGPALLANNLKLFRNTDSKCCIVQFLKSLDQLARDIYARNKQLSYQPKLFNADALKQFESAQNCHFCGKHFDNDKVWGSQPPERQVSWSCMQ